MGNFRRLDVWQVAHEAACDIHRVSARWPVEERFGLVAQVRRAAVSVVSNIAEGTGRMSDRELSRFARIARGSNQEVLAQLLIAESLGYLVEEDATRLLGGVGRVGAMRTVLVKRMGRSDESDRPMGRSRSTIGPQPATATQTTARAPATPRSSA